MSLLKYPETPDAAQDDAERRIAPRLKTLKRGKVFFNSMSSTFDCVVRNISSTGALLTLDEQAHLPREFDVRIGEERTLRPARLVYRRGMLAGIHFLEAVPGDQVATAGPGAIEVAPAMEDDDPVAEVGVQKLRGEVLPPAIMSAVRWF